MRAATLASVSMSGFCAHLRLNGFAAGAAETVIALDALAAAHTPPAEPAAKTVLRCVFSSDRGEWSIFDELFEAYWHGGGVRTAQPAKLSGTTRNLWKKSLPQLAEAEPSGRLGDAGKTGENDGGDAAQAVMGWAAHPHARGKSAASAPVPEQDKLLELGERLSRMLSRRRSRRHVAARRGRGLDFRRTFRASVSSGGEALKLLRKRRKTAAARLSVLLDVSDSMRSRKGFFLCFLAGILRGNPRAECFFFHTSLVNATSSLTGNSAAKAMQNFALHAQNAGGGTRIAESLDSFRRLYSKRCLGGRSTVLIISDGYDSDSPEKLRAAVEALRSRTPRIFWLSPALCEADAQAPKARALAAAAPFLSSLSPAQNFGQLSVLEERWKNL